MIVEVLLIICVILFVAFIAYNQSNAGYRQNYSYEQVHEPEDVERLSQQSVVGCGCGHTGGDDESECDVGLSRFEMHHHMGGSMCHTGPSNMYPGDPGYFLGSTVI